MDQQARRVRIRRRMQKRIFIGALLTVLLVAVVLLVNRLFTADRISIRNGTVYSSSELLAATGFSVGGNVLGMDKRFLTEIPASYPYVGSVSVEIGFPSDGVLVFEPSKATMALESDGQYYYLDETGKILEITETPDENLLFLYGIHVGDKQPGQRLTEEDDVEVSVLYALLAELKTNEWLDVTDYIDFSKVYNVRFSVYGKVTVQLGTSEKLADKVREAHCIYEEKNPDRAADINVKNYPVSYYTLKDEES